MKIIGRTLVEYLFPFGNLWMGGKLVLEIARGRNPFNKLNKIYLYENEFINFVFSFQLDLGHHINQALHLV